MTATEPGSFKWKGGGGSHFVKQRVLTALPYWPPCLKKIGLKKEGGVHRHPPVWKITMRQTAAIWMLSLWFHKKSSWNLFHDNMHYRVCLTPTLKWRLWIIHFSNQAVQNSTHLSRFIDSWNKVCKRFICKLNLSSASLRSSSSSSSSSTSWSSSERQNPADSRGYACY